MSRPLDDVLLVDNEVGTVGVGGSGWVGGAFWGGEGGGGKLWGWEGEGYGGWVGLGISGCGESSCAWSVRVVGLGR